MQFSKADSPMVVTLSDIVKDVNPLQFLKAELPREVTLLGIVTDVSPLQFSKTDSPMVVTLSGIVTASRLLQPKNAEFPSDVTLLLIVRFFKSCIFRVKAKLDKFLPRFRVAMGLLSKALPSMLIVSSPTSIVNSLTPLFAKADLPTDKTLSGIVTEVNPLQP